MARLRIFVLLLVAIIATVPATPATAKPAKGCKGPEIRGSSANDRLRGTKKDDVIKTGGGRDRVRSGKGDDRVCTGNGKDRANGGRGNDFLDGGRGRDRVKGGPGADFCINFEKTRSCESPVALHMDDHLDWYYEEDETNTGYGDGDTMTTTLRVGNGVVGQRGYTMGQLAPQPFLGGTATTLDFSADTDDQTQSVMAPFPVDFFGVRYSQIEVSTNGWVQFGAGAVDYFTDDDPSAEEVAEYYRAVMPYWGDLVIEPTSVPGDDPGEIRMVTAPDGNAFAIQWIDLAQCCSNSEPERDVQVVFFRDGRIRYDYPGPNAPGGIAGDHEMLVALSGGNGLGTYTEIARNTFAVPASSLLFTPADVAQGTVPSGTLTTTLPANSMPVGAGPGCVITAEPTASSDGLATCAVPPLNAGAQAIFNVTWTNPASDDLRLSATYGANGFAATDIEHSQA